MKAEGQLFVSVAVPKAGAGSDSDVEEGVLCFVAPYSVVPCWFGHQDQHCSSFGFRGHIHLLALASVKSRRASQAERHRRYFLRRDSESS
jgi:hypothetical protein